MMMEPFTTLLAVSVLAFAFMAYRAQHLLTPRGARWDWPRKTRPVSHLAKQRKG